MEFDALLEVVGYPLRFGDDGGGILGRELFARRVGEELEPTLEVGRVEGELEVDPHGIALIASGGEQDGGPEVLEGGEVKGPVGDDGIEDGTDLVIAADRAIEVLDELADLFFGDHGAILPTSGR